MICPICKQVAKTTKLNTYFCRNYINFEQSMFYQNIDYMSIHKEGMYIHYNFDTKISDFFGPRMRFAKPFKFKVINNSVEDTYNHYCNLQIFS